MRRVVITGVGFVSALGHRTEDVWKNILNGERSFRAVNAFSTAPFPNVTAAMVSGFAPLVPEKSMQAWTKNRSIQFSIAASNQALLHAGIPLDPESASKIGVVFGSTLACLELLARLDQGAVQRGPRTVDPMLFPDCSQSSPSCRVSLHLGLTAFNAILSNGSTSSLDAVHYAAQMIRKGKARIVLVGGVEELTRETFLYFASMQNLTKSERGCEPFGVHSDGITLGEGSAALVLEEMEHAQERKANILAEIAGYATHFASGSQEADAIAAVAGAVVRKTLEQGGVAQNQLDVVFASANGDTKGDALEASVLDQMCPGAAVTAMKANFGELNSAGGAFQAAICALSLWYGRIPPVLANYPSYLGSLVRKDSHISPGTALINTFASARSSENFSSLLLKAA